MKLTHYLYRRAFDIWELHPGNADTQGIPATFVAHLRATGRDLEAAEIEARARAARR